MTDPRHELDPIVNVAVYDEAGSILMVGGRPLSIAIAQIGLGEPLVLTEISYLEVGAHRVDLATLTVVPKDTA